MASAFVGYLAINELRPKAEVDRLNPLEMCIFLYVPRKPNSLLALWVTLLQLTEFVATRENEVNSLSCKHHNNSVSKF